VALPPPSPLTRLGPEQLRRLFRVDMRITEQRYAYREDETEHRDPKSDPHPCASPPSPSSGVVTRSPCGTAEPPPRGSRPADDHDNGDGDGDAAGGAHKHGSKRKPVPPDHDGGGGGGVALPESGSGSSTVTKRARLSADTKNDRADAPTRDVRGREGAAVEEKAEKIAASVSGDSDGDGDGDGNGGMLRLVVPATKLDLFRELGCADSCGVPTGWTRRSRVTNYRVPQLFVCLNDEHQVEEPTLPYGVVMEREIRTNEFGCEGATCSPGCLLSFVANGPDTFLSRPRARLMKWAVDMLYFGYGITNVVPNPPRWLLTDYCLNGYALAHYRRMGELGIYAALIGPGEFPNATGVSRKHYYRSAKTKAFLVATAAAAAAASAASTSASPFPHPSASPSSPRPDSAAASPSGAATPQATLASVVSGPPLSELSALARLAACAVVVSGSQRTIVGAVPLL